MVLDTQRKKIDPLLTTLSKPFIGISPDILTWLSIIFALIAGMFFYFSKPETELNSYFLYFAVLFVFLNGFFDAVDGKVAKLTKKTSKKGDFLDHALDRYADILIVGGIALSAWSTYHRIGYAIGLLAVVGMLLTSYMGTQSQAIGYKRNYSGLLGRADRLALLIFIPIIQHISIQYNFGRPYDLFLLEWMLVYFAIVGNITAAQRFYTTLRYFNKK